MDDIYDVAESILTGGSITITKTRGLKNWAVIDTLMLTLAKACKTLRAIRAAALEGCGQDAAILLRALFETATAVLWILQRDTKRRVLLFVAHGDQRLLVMVEEQLKTPGLKRGRKGQVAAAQAKVDQWLSLLSSADLSAVRKHWSGLGSLENTVKRISGWRRAYNTVDRATSSYAHGSDTIRHAIFEDGKRPVFKILPGDGESRGQSAWRVC